MRDKRPGDSDWHRGRQKFVSTEIVAAINRAAARCIYLVPVREVVITCPGLISEDASAGAHIPQEAGYIDIYLKHYNGVITLREWVFEYRNELKNLSTPEICNLIWRIMSPVIALHNEGIVHRDVNPSNYIIFDCPPQQLKEPMILLTDHELCQFIGEKNSDFGVGGVGTMGYAPERQGDSNIILNKGVDVYSLVLTLVYLLTGGIMDAVVANPDIFLQDVERKLSEMWSPEVASIICNVIRSPRKGRISLERLRMKLVHQLLLIGKRQES